MFTLQETAGLKAVLDRIWKSPTDRRRIASAGAKSLRYEDWLIVGGWDFAATFGPERGHINFRRPAVFEIADSRGKPLLAGRLCRSGDLPSPVVLRFRGAGWSVECDTGSEREIEHDASDLLIALQLIRDHLDSTLLRPSELREAAILQMANTSGLDADHFKRLASWFSQIAAHINP